MPTWNIRRTDDTASNTRFIYDWKITFDQSTKVNYTRTRKIVPNLNVYPHASLTNIIYLRRSRTTKTTHNDQT